MKVVVNTNVLVSAVLKDKDPEAVVLFITHCLQGAKSYDHIAGPDDA